ncbi:MAG: 3-dehydroquinate synthase family protein, partial [Longimicrobiales bacterium]|nr:3-dehydroquinate synthase family protein [Longimicrobiales bacterium]
LERLATLGLDRDAWVCAVGGGVVGDLAGFVAATYLRGVAFVQVPTTLLAMVDAAVGGKTGLDLAAGKNLVGAFHPPALVLADPEVVETLPRAERAQGLVEAVKHGAILDRAYGERVAWRAAEVLAGDPAAAAELVYRSVALKASVVAADERESGWREILNFGHTVGHALERTSGYTLPHGSAVAEGMLWEARLGEVLGVTAPGTRETLEAWIAALELPAAPRAAELAAVVAAMGADKKVREGRLRTVLLARPGEVARAPDGGWSHVIAPEAVRAAAPAASS